MEESAKEYFQPMYPDTTEMHIIEKNKSEKDHKQEHQQESSRY